MSAVVSLSAEQRAFVALVAEQVAQLLDERAQQPPERRVPRLVDAATLARQLGVSRSTVYEHASELGVRHVGDGARPRLRFDPETALEAWGARVSGSGSQTVDTPPAAGVSRRRRRRAARPDEELLPVRPGRAR